MRMKIAFSLLLFVFVTGCGYRIDQRVFVKNGTNIEDCDNIVYQVETRIVKRSSGTRVHNIVNGNLDREKIQTIKLRQYIKAEKLIECLKQKEQ